MKKERPRRIKTISEFHELRGLPKPEHPLISVIDISSMGMKQPGKPTNLILDFYSIALKKRFEGKLKYGQQTYDFDEGTMFFIAPNQVFGIEGGSGKRMKQTGRILLLHPDFLWNTPLAVGIKKYEFFDYSANEALFLSEKEETIISSILQNIQQEYHSNIDDFSQDIIIALLELILSYSKRFYHRQFITRKITNHRILNRLEDLLSEYFSGDDLMKKGLPTVKYVAAMLNVSPGYLSGLLKVLTGKSTRQHIHDALIDKAKEMLSTTDISVGELSRILGFEHSQSFNKLFKKKTKLSPLEFRDSFN